jgi:hypothetical protein
MSYSEARIHFDKAKNSAVDPAIKDIAEGFRHLSHAIEEDIRTIGKRPTRHPKSTEINDSPRAESYPQHGQSH